MASYPTTVKTYATRNNGDTIQPAHVNELGDEITAIEDGLINGTAPLNSSKSTLATLNVTGNSTLAGSVNAGNSTINNLSVTNNSTFAGSINVGASTFATLSVTGVATFSGPVVLGTVQTSTFSGGNTNNVGVSTSASYLRLDASAASTLTGFQGGDGRRRVLFVSNVGSFKFHLPHANGGSDSTNQFAIVGGVGSTLESGAGKMFVYDLTGWRLID